MHRRMRWVAVSTAFGIVVSTMLAVAVSSSSADVGPVSMAAGTVVSRPAEYGVRRVYSISANSRQDGTVSGTGYVRRDDNGFTAHFTIDCLRIDTTYEGFPTATVSGTNTSSSDPAFAGKPFWARVVDGGTKSDFITLHYTFLTTTPQDCTEEISLDPLPYFPIEDGNIVVSSGVTS